MKVIALKKVHKFVPGHSHPFLRHTFLVISWLISLTFSEINLIQFYTVECGREIYFDYVKYVYCTAGDQNKESWGKTTLQGVFAKNERVYKGLPKYIDYFFFTRFRSNIFVENVSCRMFRLIKKANFFDWTKFAYHSFLYLFLKMPILFLIALAQKIIIDYPKILLKKKPQIISLLFFNSRKSVKFL